MNTSVSEHCQCLKHASFFIPVLEWNLAPKCNIVIHTHKTHTDTHMCAVLSASPSWWGLCQHWQAVVLDWLQTDKLREGGDAWLCQVPWLDSPPGSWGVRKSCVASVETNPILNLFWIHYFWQFVHSQTQKLNKHSKVLLGWKLSILNKYVCSDDMIY